jgi:hypothetical protein
MAEVFTLSVEANEAITSYVKGHEAQTKRDGKLLDILQAEGIQSSMLVAPRGDEDRTLYDAIKASVVAGFDATKRKLLEMPTKGLSDGQKKAKFKVQQSVGGWMGTLRRDLATREAAESAESGEDKTDTKSTFESRLKRDLTKYIAQIQALKGAQFTVVEMLNHLRSASALIK